MMTLRIAWRNLLRNPRRTAITVTAVTLTTAILIATFALMEGMKEQMVRSATRLVVGDAQAHAPGYRERPTLFTAIEDPGALVEQARSHGMHAAPRGYGYGLVSSGSKSAGARYMGVDPAAERAALELHEELHEGSFLAAEPRGHAVIGRKLARSLDAALGSEIVAVVQAADGSMGNEIYHVTGILKNVSEEMDRSAVILHRDDFDGLFVAEGRVHEIAFGAGAHPVDEAVSILERAAGDTEVKSWRELLPATADMVAVTGAVMYLFSLIFFMAAGLGVLNTMLMAMYDRVREFGLIKSLGATSLRIVREVSAEAFLLAVVSTALGLVLGLAATAYLQIVGIDLRAFGSGSFSFAGIAWDPLWRAHLTATHVLVAVPTMWVVCVLSALYPAGKAARMDPVEAMTHV